MNEINPNVLRAFTPLITMLRFIAPFSILACIWCFGDILISNLIRAISGHSVDFSTYVKAPNRHEIDVEQFEKNEMKEVKL